MKNDKYSPEVSGHKILSRINRLLDEDVPNPLKKEWIINGFTSLWNRRENNRIDFENGFSYLISRNIIVIDSEEVILKFNKDIVEREDTVDQGQGLSKIFISHATKDKQYVKYLIKALKEMGIGNNQISCSSFEGYGVPADGDIFEWIKKGLTEDVLVLFVLSETYFTRPVCMCEMGAAWVLSKKHIPVLIPPLEFNQIQGVIPHSKKAYKINDTLGISSIKEVIEDNFNLRPVNYNIWSEFLKDYESNINELIQQDEKEKLRRRRRTIDEHLESLRNM